MKNIWSISAFLLIAILLNTSQVNALTKVMTADSQKKMTPTQAIERLKEGNNRFLSDKMVNRDYLEQVKIKSAGQYPYAAIISCIDSRVPPEVVFDTNIGDLFVGRIAGNFVTTEMLGSLEFATAVAGAKLIVVLGHTECGAIKGICDDVNLGLLTATLAQLKPSVDNVISRFKGKTSKDPDFVEAVTMDNITRTMHEIKSKSSVISKLVTNGQVAIVGARYNVETGAVDFL